jgi:hypothetical protein
VSGLRTRNERGVVFPSPVVMLSIIAIAMAGIAYVATRGAEPTERELTTVAQRPTQTPSPSPTLAPQEPKKIKKRKPPAVQRGEVYVDVYNNSGITGLAARVAAKASDAGWQVVGSDNWYGTIPASTVYFPARLKAQAELLGKDLGIKRLRPTIAPMRGDRLTVILTRDYS